LLTKSCHDIDILLWLLCSPVDCWAENSQQPHLPSTVSSTGSLHHFKRARKPREAGTATNCLSCPVEPTCKYSAKRIYVGEELAGLETGNKGWPVRIVLPDIESYGDEYEARQALLAELANDYDATTPEHEVARRSWYGRCVYECDNDVCDEQIVTISWEDDAVEETTPGSKRPLPGRTSKTAVFHMVAHTKKICDRYTRLYGVDGEIFADSKTITVENFQTGETRVFYPCSVDQNHGGGDIGLTYQFILAIDKVKNHGWSTERAQRELIGCTLEEVVRSHAMVFCAEEARRGKKVIKWSDWWKAEVEAELV